MSDGAHDRAGASRRRDRARLTAVASVVLLAVWALAGLAELAGDEVALRQPVGGLTDASAADEFGAAATAIPPGIRIEEVTTSSASTIADEDGQHPDWLELHNPTGEPRPLGGLVLRTSAGSSAWELPDRDLAPGEHLVVFASGKDRRETTLHTDFRLSQQGVDLVLARTDGRELVDRVAVPELTRDTSFGRDPDHPGRWCHFAFPTPGDTNAPECHDDRLGLPTFSLTSGFYDEAVTLTIDPPLPDADLLYTLDGSYPDPEGNADATFTYDGPLRITDRSDEPDRLTGIETSFYIAHQDPVAPVEKATVVRARTPYGAERVEVFFVGERRASTLPVFHLAADPDHLFDHERGIYVAGLRYDEYLASDDYDPDHRWEVPANYMERGREWERPAEDDLRRRIVLHHCHPGGACDYAAPAGVRIHGNISRAMPIKTLRLYARRDYGPAAFTYPFFGDRLDERHRRLLLRNSGNDWRGTLLTDGFLQSLVAHLGPETQAYEPAVLFLNGEYWGIHNLRERYDQHYLEVSHGIDPDDAVILGRRLGVEHGHASDVDELVALLDQLASGTLSPSQARRSLEQHVDVDDLTDYLALELFSGNEDWPGNNVRMWRTRTSVDDVPVADGRWRWMVFDLDQAGGSVRGFDPDTSVLERLLVPVEEPTAAHGLPVLTQALLADEASRTTFVTRLADHLNTTFAADRTVPALDELVEQLEPEVPAHAARWPAFGTVADWEERIGSLRTFLHERPARQFADLDARLELGGTSTLTVRPTAGGRVQVGSIDLGEDAPGLRADEPFTGTYFRDVPLTLTAMADPGYRFVHWEGIEGLGATEPTLQLRGHDGRALAAVFERA